MKIKVILSVLFAFTVVTFTSAQSQGDNNFIVLVKYKTQPGKDSLGLASLQNLVSHVKKEPNYVSIVIHVDPTDKTSILLYERWSSEDYYKGGHMHTSHLRQFISDSRAFLAGPPEITFWKISSIGEN